MPTDQNISAVKLDEECSRLEASLKSCRAVVRTYRERIANDRQAIEPESGDENSKST